GCLAVTTSDLAVTIAVSVICGREDPANLFEGFVASRIGQLLVSLRDLERSPRATDSEKILPTFWENAGCRRRCRLCRVRDTVAVGFAADALSFKALNNL
ncbi:hypothetical protein NKJ56_30195, partial [Mesorhizobium sp. M0093]